MRWDIYKIIIFNRQETIENIMYFILHSLVLHHSFLINSGLMFGNNFSVALIFRTTIAVLGPNLVVTSEMNASKCKNEFYYWHHQVT